MESSAHMSKIGQRFIIQEFIFMSQLKWCRFHYEHIS